MEAVIFVGGVSLGQPATSIPIAAIVGLVCGLICGFLIYQFASRSSKLQFLVPQFLVSVPFSLLMLLSELNRGTTSCTGQL